MNKISHSQKLNLVKAAQGLYTPHQTNVAPTTNTPAPTTNTPAPTTNTPAPTTNTPAPTTSVGSGASVSRLHDIGKSFANNPFHSQYDAHTKFIQNQGYSPYDTPEQAKQRNEAANQLAYDKAFYNHFRSNPTPQQAAGAYNPYPTNSAQGFFTAPNLADAAQLALSTAGQAPVLGMGADALNAGVSGFRTIGRIPAAMYSGDWDPVKEMGANFALDLGSTLPAAGNVAGAYQMAKRTKKLKDMATLGYRALKPAVNQYKKGKDLYTGLSSADSAAQNWAAGDYGAAAGDLLHAGSIAAKRKIGGKKGKAVRNLTKAFVNPGANQQPYAQTTFTQNPSDYQGFDTDRLPQNTAYSNRINNYFAQLKNELPSWYTPRTTNELRNIPVQPRQGPIQPRKSLSGVGLGSQPINSWAGGDPSAMNVS